MFERLLPAGLVALILNLTLAVQAATTDMATLLKQADAYRLPAAAVRVETDVEMYRNDALDKERRYTVYIKPDRRSLVIMRSPSEIGQKALMLGDQFWLLMPDSQRPLRITANQKLLGEASTGDIASMIWSEDYEGKTTEDVACPTPPTARAVTLHSTAPSHCIQLHLEAARPGVTYAQVKLVLDRASKLPIKADLFVASGKQAKEAWYEPKLIDGGQRIMAMLLLDAIQPTRYTMVRYRSIAAKDSPDELYNPAALVRNPLAGW